MEPIEAELEGRVARLFARRPDLWRFTVRDRSGLPDNLDPTSLAGEFFIFEIGLSPRLVSADELFHQATTEAYSL